VTHAAGTDTASAQAALRRIATRVAEGASAADLFGAVAEEVAEVLDVRAVLLARYESERELTVLASHNEPSFAPGTRWPLDGPSVSATVLATGRPARIDDYSDVRSTIAERVRDAAIRTNVGAPIVVDGTIWGVLTVGSREREGLPADTEERLSDFTELIALAISNAESRDRLRRLANEQAGLRRAAMLVAEGATTAALCAAVLEEVVQVLEAPAGWLIRYEAERTMSVVAAVNDPSFPPGSRWPLEGSSVSAAVHDFGRASRIDDYAGLPGAIATRTRDSGFISAVGAPITVDGAVWGAICVGTRDHVPLPSDTVERLSDFTELAATAISNAESREALHRLADEQTALRRVATLVARASPPDRIFAAVAEEVAGLLGFPRVEVVRYDDPAGGTATVIGATGEHPFSVGSRWPLDSPSVMKAVYESAGAARIDDYGDLGGMIADAALGAGFVSAIGSPIIVDGSTWGCVIAISTHPDPIPEGAENRLSLFTELVATAVSNLQAHDDLRGLAEEQAALRRVATLVAEGIDSSGIFDVVCSETGRLLGATAVNL